MPLRKDNLLGVARSSQRKTNDRQYRRRRDQVATAQVCMTSARPESPEGSARGKFEERNLSWSGMVTRPGVLTRSMTRTLAHPPTFAALPNSPNRRVVLQTFVPDNAVPSGHTASTYVTERTSSLPPEEIARQFQEMQERERLDGEADKER